MILNVNKGIILESLSLLEEEMSQMAKNGMKVGAAGAGLGLAHAGTFGTGIKNAVDGGYDAMRGSAAALGSKVGNEASAAGHFYGGDDMFKNKESSPHSDVRQKVEHDAHKASTEAEDHDADDDSGMGLLGMAGTAAAGLAAGGLAAHVAGNGVAKTKQQAGNVAGKAWSGVKHGASATGHGVKNFGSATREGAAAFGSRIKRNAATSSNPYGRR